MKNYLVSLRNSFVELPESFKRSLFYILLFSTVTMYAIFNYIDEYLEFLKEASAIESLVVNFGLFGYFMVFAIFIAFSSNPSKRESDVASVMGYNSNFISPPVLFGRRQFRMVSRVKNGIRLLVPYSSDIGILNTRDKLQEIEHNTSCEVCGNEYGDESMRSMYFIIEGSVRMFFGFQIGTKKIEEHYGYCELHYKDYAEDTKVEVNKKYDLEVGDSVSVEYNENTINGTIKDIEILDILPSAARLRDRDHPENPEERVFYIACEERDSDIIYDLSDRVWSSSGEKEKLSNNGKIYYNK